MNDTFYLIRKHMLAEFDWLEKQYPLGRKMSCSVHIMHEEPGRDDGGISGFAFYNYIGSLIDTDIFIFLDTQKRFDESDLRIMKKYNIETDYDLFFWMLYHEYGHVIDMKKTRKKSKFRTVKKRMAIYLKKTKKIRENVKKEKITEQEGEVQYRQLEEEKVADRFANTVYKLRKSVIKEYIHGGENT